jgi:hypothetical protein
MREDEARGSATVLLVAASVASLLGVGFALTFAGRASGPLQVLLIGVGVLAVVLSWTVVNTVFTLRYADLHFGSGHKPHQSDQRTKSLIVVAPEHLRSQLRSLPLAKQLDLIDWVIEGPADWDGRERVCDPRPRTPSAVGLEEGENHRRCGHHGPGQSVRPHMLKLLASERGVCRSPEWEDGPRPT